MLQILVSIIRGALMSNLKVFTLGFMILLSACSRNADFNKMPGTKDTDTTSLVKLEWSSNDVIFPSTNINQESSIVLSLKNNGTSSSRAINLDWLTADTTISIDSNNNSCTGRVLQSKESCSVKILYRPTVAGSSMNLLKGHDLLREAQVLFRGLAVDPNAGNSNLSPVAFDNTLTVIEDTPSNGILTAMDYNNAALIYEVVTQGTKGNVNITNTSTGMFTYTPSANATGADSFTFKVTNPTSQVSNVATISVNIAPVNDAPIANNSNFNTNEDTAHTGTLSAIDVDGDSLTYTMVSQGTKGTVVITDSTTGAFTYTPNLNVTGADSFTFRVNDGTVNSNIATVSVTIDDINDLPIANNQTITVTEDTVYSGTLVGSDTESAITYSVVSQGTKGTVTITDAATGAFTYTPNLNATGADSFTFKVNDGSSDSNIATVSVTITPVNDAPVANSASFNTDEDLAYNGTLTASDVEGDSLTYSVVSQGTKGTVTITDAATGAFTYIPNLNATGSDSFTFKVNDGNLDSNVATITVNINPLNDLPVADAQAITVTEDTVYSGTLTGSDTESAITYSVVSQGTRGTLVITDVNTGAFTYTPNLNETGADSFTFKVNDGTTDSNIATVSVTITPVNDAPIANSATINVDEDTVYVGSLSGSDVEGSPLTYSVTAQGTKGTVVITDTTTGAFTYTPNLNATGSDSFTFKVNDGNLDSVDALITVNIQGFNDAPIANNDSIVVTEDVVYSGTLAGSDVESSPLTYSVVSQGTKGVVVITNASTGAFTYTPSLNENGADSFTFKVNDGTTDSNVATVSVTITPVNDAPVADDLTRLTLKNNAVLLSLTGSDVDGDSIGYVLVSSPANGVLSGSFPDLTYTPNHNFAGSDSFTFKVNDGSLDSNVAIVSITVSNTNSAPVATGMSLTVIEDTPKNDTLLATDPDVDTLTYSVVSQGTKGTVVITNASTGAFTYTPNLNETGADSFTFKANDGALDSNTVTVSVTITPVNDTPIANNQSITTNEDTVYTGTLVATDVDGDALTYSVVSQGTKGTVVITNASTGAFTYTPNLNATGSDSFTFRVNDGTVNSNTATVSVTISPVNDAPVAFADTVSTNEDTAKAITLVGYDEEGSALTYTIVSSPTKGTLSGTLPNLTYTPNSNVTGADSFTFKVNDGTTDSNVATVSITITPVNDAPIANNQSITTNEDTVYTGTLTASDTDTDPLTYSVVSQGSKGIVVITNASTGAFTYTPNLNATGADSFTFRVNDGTVNSNTATVSVTITPVNDAPVANAQSISVTEDTLYSGTLTASDVDGDALTYSLVTQGSNGTVVITNSTTGAFTYTPNSNTTGSDSFTFRVNDGTVNSNTATVSVTITGTNDAPVANNQSITTNEDTVFTGSLTASDTDGDTLTYSVVSQGSKGTVVITNSTTGAFTYTPNSNATGSDSFTFRVNDGTVNSNTATVSVTITPVNDTPVANNNSFTTNEDTAYNGTLTASDVDGDALTYSVVSQGTKGTVNITNSVTGAFTYTPNSNATGADSFTFRVNDGTVNSNTATVSVTITPVNDAPTANSQSVSVNEDASLGITLVGTDPEGSALTYTIVSSPTNGTLTGTGANRTYTPNANYNGADSFTFKVNDGSLDSSTVTVTITVNPVNDTPVATGGSVSTNKNVAVGVSLTATDIDGDTLNYIIVTGPLHGTLTGSGSSRTYTPVTNYVGADSFTFKVNDGTIDSNTVTINITVINPNQAPTANAQTVTALVRDANTAITLTGTDPESDPLTYTIVTNPSSGTLSGSGASRTYTPSAWTSCGSEGATCSFTGTKLVKYGSASKFVVRVATSSIGCNNDNFSDPDPGAGKTCAHRPVSDSFTFKVNDGSLDSTNATVTINFTDWYNTAWTKRKKIVFNAPISADIMDTPILVRLDSSRIDYTNTQNSGQDLRFIGSGGEVLPHEIETWNESGISYVWVKVSIGAYENKNKHIWMYYGNASASDGQNKTSVWSNGYAAVWHMNQTSGTVLDSTSNNNHGTVNGTLTRNTSGPLGNSYTSASNGACFSVPHNASQAISSTLTMETWAKVVTGGSARYFVQKDVQYSSNWYNAYAFGATSTSTKLFTKATDDDGNNTIGSEDTLIATNTSLISSQWQYHVAVYDGDFNNSSKSIKLFTDGKLLQHQTNYGGSLYSGTNWQYLNIMGDCSSNGFLGSMDEVRISNVLRSADWVKVQYLSMTDNLVMYSNEQTISTAMNPFSYMLRISSNLDDGNIFRHDNSLHQSGYNSTGKNWIGETNQQAAWGYHRFILPVAIPSGTSLYNSKLKLDGAYDGAQIWNNASNYLKVYAQRSSNPGQVTAANQYPGGAGGVTASTAVTNWNSSSLTWDSYDVNLSPSLNSPINEVISTYGGLSSGSAIQLWSVRGAVFNCASWCEVGSKDYSGGALDAGQLLIEW